MGRSASLEVEEVRRGDKGEDAMKALTYRGPRDVACAEVPSPVLSGDLDAIVEVTLAGICGSDLHIWGGHGFTDDIGFIVGHEAVGIVREVGAGVIGFAPGDRVLATASVGCTTCSECAAGRVSTCTFKAGKSWQSSCYGLGHALAGTQAEYLRVPNADVNLATIPDSVGDEAALVLTDNAPTAWYGCRRARIVPGDSVLVIGLGPVGLMSVQSAIAMGAGQVLAIDPVPDRRARAQAMGARAIDVGDDRKSQVRAVRDATGGRGVDAVIEAVGADATIDLALRAVRVRGRVSVIGVSQNNRFTFPMEIAQLKELDFAIGLCSVQAELPTLLALTENGRLDPGAVVSHRLPLSEGDRAYQMYGSRSDSVCKVVLDPRL